MRQPLVPGPAVELTGVSLSFGKTKVLDDVNLCLEPGAFVGLIGPNGGGKTVLLKVMLGLLEPDEGDVRIFGRPPRKARGDIAYVAQHARFDRDFPIDVLDVVLMGRLGPRTLLRRPSGEDRERALHALEQVDLADLAHRQIGKLSGGQLQRVLIARGLAMKARVLLLDEPTSNLDPKVATRLYDTLSALGPELTLVLVSHDIGVIDQHVTSVACLNRKLHYHGDKAVAREVIEETYGCPVDFIVHAHTHRVLGVDSADPHDHAAEADA